MLKSKQKDNKAKKIAAEFRTKLGTTKYQTYSKKGLYSYGIKIKGSKKQEVIDLLNQILVKNKLPQLKTNVASPWYKKGDIVVQIASISELVPKIKEVAIIVSFKDLSLG
jgi:hypothetical protein